MSIASKLSFFENLSKSSDGEESFSPKVARAKSERMAILTKIQAEGSSASLQSALAATNGESQEYQVTVHESLNTVNSPIIVLVGQTGGGKSSIANDLLSTSIFKESSKLRSCTTDIKAGSGKFFSIHEEVTVVDTAGFLDSENRDSAFFNDVVSFLRDFPKGKLAVLGITIPLTETRANSSYLQMLDQVALLFGENIFENTIFITTCENQLRDKKLVEQKKLEWAEWLKTTGCIPNPKFCNYIYGSCTSLDSVRSLFLAAKPTTPDLSTKIDTYISGNPHATVADVIQNVQQINSMKQSWEQTLQSEIAEKERWKQQNEASSSHNARLQQKINNCNSEITVLKQRLARSKLSFFENLSKSKDENALPRSPLRKQKSAKMEQLIQIQAQSFSMDRVQAAIASNEGSADNTETGSGLTLHDSFDTVQHPIILLVGQTGGGKSSIANQLLSTSACKEGSSLRSCTSDINIISGKFFGRFEDVTVVDTPGFLDSENRDGSFFKEIIIFLRSFPKDKLAVLAITIPLTETRANNSYMQMIDQVELLFGEKIFDNTIFITTCENQLTDDGLIAQRKREWEQWLKTKACIPFPKMCYFIYGNDTSLEAVRSLYLTSKPTTPELSANIDTYLSGNPHATVADVIQNVEELNSMKQSWEQSVQSAIAERENWKKQHANAVQQNERLQQRINNYNAEITTLKQKLATPPPVVVVHYHHHCCFPASATAVIKGISEPVPLSLVKEGQLVLTANSCGKLCYSEVYFATGKQVDATFTAIYYKNAFGNDEKLLLTADHVIFISLSASDKFENAISLVSEYVKPNKHFIWVKQGEELVSKQVTKVTIENSFGLYTILVKEHKLLVNSVLASAYEISHTWGILDTIPMRMLYSISPSFVASSYNKIFCEYYDLIVESVIKQGRFFIRKIFGYE